MPYLFDKDPDAIVDVVRLSIFGFEDTPVVSEDDTNELYDESEGRMRSIIEIREHTVVLRDYMSLCGKCSIASGLLSMVAPMM